MSKKTKEEIAAEEQYDEAVQRLIDDMRASADGNRKPVTIDRPGFYPDLHMRDYILDPCPAPSLSKGVVHDIVYRTLKRAAWRHPRIGNAEPANASIADFGTALHNDITGGRKIVFAPSKLTDWKKDIAKDFKAAAYERWFVPMLEKERDDVKRCADVVRELLAPFGTYTCETTIVVFIGGVWRRMRADILTDDGRYDIEIKTATNCNPVEWCNFAALRGGYDIQAAMRVDGHADLGKPRKLLWLVVEQDKPHDGVIIEPTESFIGLGRRKVDGAAPRWLRALSEDKFPSYARTAMSEPKRGSYDAEDRGV